MFRSGTLACVQVSSKEINLRRHFFALGRAVTESRKTRTHAKLSCHYVQTPCYEDVWVMEI